MIEIRKTAVFTKWIDNLRDIRGRARIQARIERLAAGHAGDVRPVGEGVSELRIDCGPGYRVYFARQGSSVIILLFGGDKSSQSRDIKRAVRLARELQEENDGQDKDHSI
jgi:putative addiction module killer protein